MHHTKRPILCIPYDSALVYSSVYHNNERFVETDAGTTPKTINQDIFHHKK